MNTPGMNILIVEDEALLSMDLELSLKDMGHTVLESVPSGEEALSFVGRNRPDIVLIDIKLDGNLDGIETSRMIMKEYDVPVIFMTGNTDTDTLSRAEALGPVGIIKKPIKDHELIMFLRNAVIQ